MLKVLDHLEEWLIAFLIAAATIVVFVAVVHRYAAGMPIPVLQDWLLSINLSWAQELCIYMFIWMAKFGAAYGVRTGIHVGVPLLLTRVPARSRKQVILFSLLCGAFFTGMIATFGGSFVAEMFKTGQQSNDLEAPMWTVYLAIPVGSGLMCFRFLQVAWFYYWTGELPHHNEAQVEGIEITAPALHPAQADPTEDPNKASPLGLILILVPILILMVCLGEKASIIEMPHAVRAGMIFVLLIALMLTGIPVSIALGLTVLTFLFTLTAIPIEAVSMKLFTGIESFEIMAIPFFILAGNFLTHGGVARRMIDFATAMIGHWYGGLRLAGVMACALFAAVSGSSPATVVAIGAIILPAMVQQGFPKRFGAGVIATSGALGILIPPSIVMVIYSGATGGTGALDPPGHRVLSASVGQLFMAGVVPGLILASMLGATTFYRAWRNDYPRMPKATWAAGFVAFP